MAIRDTVVIVIILLSAPVALFSPFFGVLMWTWIAYFNPHRYGWGIAKYGFFQPAIIIAIPTLVGLLFAPKNVRFMTREASLLVGLWAWFCLTTLYITRVPEFSGHVLDAAVHLEEVSKILLMTFVTILVVTTKTKLRFLVFTILASFGVRAFVVAIWYLRTGGQFMVWGPEGSFIYDNNDFGLALNMTIPMFFFMARATPKAWLRIVLRVLMVCVVICVIGTYSRGALVGLAVIALAIVAKSRQKILGMLSVAVALVCILMFTTHVWQDRMSDFLQGNLDASAYSRLIAWGGGWNLAMQYPLTGGGFDVFTDEAIFPSFVPPALRGALYSKIHHLHSSHSIYFEMLGEQGFVGLGLFLLLLFCCYGRLRKLRKQARQHPQLEWVEPYTHMFEVTLLAYMVNGATLGRAYFDFFYQVVALVIILEILAMRELREIEVEAEPVLALEEAVAV
jgi:probable O-glycosylation ligase (exosortase A-associated)